MLPCASFSTETFVMHIEGGSVREIPRFANCFVFIVWR